MKLNTKVTVFSGGLAVFLIVTLTLITFYFFRQYTLATAKDHVKTAAEIVRVNLTESMIHGVIDRREGFFGRLREVEGFLSARVVRSEALVGQFGPGTPREVAVDAVEQAVMKTKEPVYEIFEKDGMKLFRGTVPYIATSHGIPNCLQCHQVNDGVALGAVTIVFSIDHLERKALEMVFGMFVAVALFVTVAWLMLTRMTRPISDTAQDVDHAVQLALTGNFSSRVQARTDDEVGDIARNLNLLLGTIGDGLKRITESVMVLIGRPPSPGENQVEATIEMVNILTQAGHFKQAIEEDESRAEIYQRLANVLKETFMIDEFSLYEVTPGSHQMRPLLVDGQVGAECRWCDPEILVRNDACRCRRTGHIVDGVNNPGICYAFQPPAEAGEGRGHICLPVMQTGAVGNVLQLVASPDNQVLIDQLVPFVNVYLREAAPVLESKRLMESLREANLRDPMTGLNNRRFLEEYVETLLGAAQRRKSHLAILMLDLDYFKMINDSYGHDAGDTVLKALAKTLRQAVRGSDMVIRYGGEEFLILLQDTGADDGERVAENIRHAVADLKIPIGPGTVLQKTISIGVSDFPNDSPTFWQAVKFADVALYKAKESGRNRVVRFTPELWKENQEY
jgi:diguanylate cyclase (GGDEF)-like protein